MTIKDLMRYLRVNYPEVLRAASFTDFRNKRFFIDAHPLLYRYVGCLDERASTAEVLELFVADYHRFHARNIKPVYVFDGPVKPPQKKFTLDQRAAVSANRQARGLRVLEVSRPLVDEAIEYIISQGGKDKVDYFLSPDDGEEMAAKMATSSDDCVFSDDLDSLAFGAPQLVRPRDMLHVQLADVMDALQLDVEAFRDYCILCGCDFTGKIPQIGPIRAHRLIKMHGSIEEMQKKIVGLPPAVWKACNFESARWVFQRKLAYDPSDAPHMATEPLSLNDRLETLRVLREYLMAEGLWRTKAIPSPRVTVQVP